MCKSIATFLVGCLNKALTENLKIFRIQKQKLKPSIRRQLKDTVFHGNGLSEILTYELGL